MASSPKTLPDVQHIGFPMSIQNERERVFFNFCNSPYNTSLLAADVFHIVASLLPEKRAANMTGKNDIRDVKPFVLIFANQNKGQNATRVTHRDLSRKNLILSQATTKLICF